MWAVKEAPAAALPPRERFHWAVRIRWLAIAGFLALGMVAWSAGVLRDPLPCAAAAVVAAALNAVNAAAVRRWRWVGAATLLAVAGDVLLITVLVALTGGAYSPFVAMYAVQVLAAALLVEVRLALLCVALAVLALAAGAALAAPVAPLVDATAASFTQVWTAFLAFGLGLVAYVGGHVSRQLRHRESELENANAELSGALASLQRGNVELQSAFDRLAQTELQLAQSEKMRALGDFVAGVAHELNNPIAIVAANLQILGVELAATVGSSTGAGFCDVLRDCEEAVARAARIVGDLRQFSRDGGARRWQLVDMNERLARTVDLARHLFGADVSIQLDLRGRPIVRGVAAELDQVVLNLLSNAAQAIDRCGRVLVSTAEIDSDGERQLILRVADDGPGVPPELQHRIFEPFFTTRPEGRGVGLGLSLSFAVAERHGGTLRVVPGASRGACFEMTLPLAEAATATSA